MIKSNLFEKYLKRETDLSDKSIKVYMDGIRQYAKHYKDTDKESLEKYKEWMVKKYKPNTVNIKLRALNLYNRFIESPVHIKLIRIQKKTYLDNVISEKDYTKLCKCLKNDHKISWYLLIRFLGCTGVRISEALAFRKQYIYDGYYDVLSKGNKLRRVYIPKAFIDEAKSYWSADEEGLAWTWRIGTIDSELKRFGKKYHINKEVLHAHSFRHMFGKKFLEATGDIVLLADLMGHDSINTTRIYLTKTHKEMTNLVNKNVNW